MNVLVIWDSIYSLLHPIESSPPNYITSLVWVSVDILRIGCFWRCRRRGGLATAPVHFREKRPEWTEIGTCSSWRRRPKRTEVEKSTPWSPIAQSPSSWSSSAQPRHSLWGPKITREPKHVSSPNRQACNFGGDNRKVQLQ